MEKTVKSKCTKYYKSPRFTGEILDCSLPLTFDTYSACSFNCLYCFSYFQKCNIQGSRPLNTGAAITNYQEEPSFPVNINAVKKLFQLQGGDKDFYWYIKERKVMQWGGLSDPFDFNEKKQRVTLELLKFFKEIDYPLCISTKGVFWTDEVEYINLFTNQKNWNCKFSIINLDKKISSQVELGCPSPQLRLEAIKKYTDFQAGGATLRLRPFIIGMSDKNDDYINLIEQAYKNGAAALSTEFFCLEARANINLKMRYEKMSNAIGFDIYDFYRRNSNTIGYRRLNYEIKKPYIEKMEALCKKLGMRFYVSDAHHKEKCNNSCCCGLDASWNYSKGTFTHALLIAKEKGVVHFSDISQYLEPYKVISPVGHLQGVGLHTPIKKAQRKKQSIYQIFRQYWNTPNQAKSPYKYFSGILEPIGLDENKDVIYKYAGK